MPKCQDHTSFTAEPLSQATTGQSGNQSLEKAKESQLLDMQEYALPPVVQDIADSYVKIGGTMAIIGSLLAAFQICIAQTAFTHTATSPGYSISYWLSYTGVYWNVGGVLSILVFIKYTRNLVSSARSLLTCSNSWPYLVSQGQPIPSDIFSTPSRDRDFTLMINFGLEESMLPVWKAASWAFYMGMGMLFLNLALWAWLI